jgi:hypothetical protein
MRMEGFQIEFWKTHHNPELSVLRALCGES